MRNLNPHAVVIGGSMAGMLAAKTLSDHYSSITILERDSASDAPEPRPGVPQGRHLHALLPCGQQIIEQMFPEITKEWCEAGGELLDIGMDFAWRTPPGWGVRFPSGIRMLAASRPLIETIVRRRVLATPNITLMNDTIADSLIHHGNRVTGLTLGPKTITADLVVDASGRPSRAPEWLSAMGYDRPRESMVTAHLGYATRVYRRINGPQNWRALYIQAAPPDRTRAGIAFPIEDDRWIVTVCGGDRDYAPTTEDGFLQFIKSLPEPQLYDLVTSCEPLGGITAYRRMENRWRHFENLRCMPEGFIVTGDAVCAFNPVYGQGMTAAALGALALKECLSDTGSAFPHRFHRNLARRLRTPWMLATGEDSRYRCAEGTHPGLTDRFMQWYVDRVLATSTRDYRVRHAFLRVLAMLDEPPSLFKPSVVRRIVATRAKPAAAQPEMVQSLARAASR
jgi:2-polyprenyl-6-methoxyphenol hydroxylase-like FAD-dependent oxidoreductase